MIQEDNVIVIDVDGTLCEKKPRDTSYQNVLPNKRVVDKLREYKEKGFYVIIDTSRNMRTYQGNLGKINAHTLSTLVEWLNRHEIPYDELHVGKPWAGRNGFCVDDRTIRPNEFLSLSYEAILTLTGRRG